MNNYSKDELLGNCLDADPILFREPKDSKVAWVMRTGECLDFKTTIPSVTSIIRVGERDGFMYLMGGLFDCGGLLSVVESKPESFEIEIWRESANHLWHCEWKHVESLKFDGVEWLDSGHSTDGGTSACCGLAKFTCKEHMLMDVCNGGIIFMHNNEKHPSIVFKQRLKESLRQG